jgi:hypothetical protein
MTATRKTITATLAALTLGLGVIATASPAAAWGHRHGGWHGGAVAAGVVGALALGAMAASAAPAYSDCYVDERPVYNRRGQYIGTRSVRVCD